MTNPENPRRVEVRDDDQIVAAAEVWPHPARLAETARAVVACRVRACAPRQADGPG